MIAMLLGGMWKYILGAFAGAVLLFAARKSGADSVELKHEREVNKHNEKLLQTIKSEKEFVVNIHDDRDLEFMRDIINNAKDK